MLVLLPSWVLAWRSAIFQLSGLSGLLLRNLKKATINQKHCYLLYQKQYSIVWYIIWYIVWYIAWYSIVYSIDSPNSGLQYWYGVDCRT